MLFLCINFGSNSSGDLIVPSWLQEVGVLVPAFVISMSLLNCLCFHLPQFCDLGALGQLCSTARDWIWQTKRAMAKSVMQTKFDVDQLCARHDQDLPSLQRVRFLLLRNRNRDLMDRETWIDVCRLQCCLSHLRRIVVNNQGELTLGAILRYLMHGMVGNIRIDERTLVDFLNEVMGARHDYRDMLDEECTHALAYFSQTWSRSCVCDFTIGSVLVVLFKSKIEQDFHRVLGCSIN